MRRFLDVLRQHLRWLVVCLALVPCLLGAGGFWLNDSRVVTAWVRVDPASFIADVLPDAFIGVSPSQGSPAAAAADLVAQVVTTDWFADSVLTSADAGSRTSRPTADSRRGEIADLHSHLGVFPQTTYLVALRYSTDQPARGVRLLDAILRRLGDAASTIQAERATAAVERATAVTQKARDDMDRSIAEARTYSDAIQPDGAAPGGDPTARRLAAAAQAAIDHYRRLAALTNHWLLVRSAVHELAGQGALAVGGPAVEPGTRTAAAVRYSLIGLTATGVLEVMFGCIEGPCLLVSVPCTGHPAHPA
jgi:hypothetical protein